MELPILRPTVSSTQQVWPIWWEATTVRQPVSRASSRRRVRAHTTASRTLVAAPPPAGTAKGGGSSCAPATERAATHSDRAPPQTIASGRSITRHFERSGSTPRSAQVSPTNGSYGRLYPTSRSGRSSVRPRRSRRGSSPLPATRSRLCSRRHGRQRQRAGQAPGRDLGGAVHGRHRGARRAASSPK
jgi:hypothetical protein